MILRDTRWTLTALVFTSLVCNMITHVSFADIGHFTKPPPKLARSVLASPPGKSLLSTTAIGSVQLAGVRGHADTTTARFSVLSHAL